MLFLILEILKLFRSPTNMASELTTVILSMHPTLQIRKLSNKMNTTDGMMNSKLGVVS